MPNMDLKGLLPKILQNDFWKDLMNVITEELNNVKRA